MEKEIKTRCVLLSITECIYWYSRVTWSSMFVDGGSYVSFPGSLRLCIHFVACFVSEMSDFLLGALGYCLFHHYVRNWCDFTPCLIWVDHHSFWCYSLHYHRPRFRFWFIILTSPLISFLTTTHLGFDILFTSLLHISLSVWSASFVSSSTLCSH